MGRCQRGLRAHPLFDWGSELSVQRWGFGVVAALLMALTALAQPAAASTERVDMSDLETLMAKTVAANPGSKQISRNVIQLDENVIMILPVTDGVSTQALADCPSGFQCAWPDVNFGGPALGGRICDYMNYFDYVFWNTRLGVWDDFAYDVSSVTNNIPGVKWSQFWSPRNGANFNALLGAPAPYVGDKWNDSFTGARGCSGQAG